MFDQAVEVSATEPVARLSARALQFGGIHALELLPGRLALHFPSVLTPAECAELIAGVYAAREAWTEEPAGHQYTLGRSYHLHHEQQREEEYFAQAASADALVRRSTPGLQGRMVALLRLLVKDRVAQRAGWCGACVHIFPAGGRCAEQGGELHFDIDGLEPAALSAGTPALTCALMLQPAQEGGELRIWDRLYAGEASVAEPDPREASVLCSYGAGDLVVLDSRRLHRVARFGGTRDRITVTLRAAYVRERGLWEVWL